MKNMLSYELLPDASPLEEANPNWSQNRRRWRFPICTTLAWMISALCVVSWLHLPAPTRFIFTQHKSITSAANQPTDALLSLSPVYSGPHATASGPVSRYLQRRGITNETTIFLVIADSRYVPTVRNFDLMLRRHGRSQSLLTLCIDSACVDQLEEHGLMAYYGFVNLAAADRLAVADMKFRSNLDLLEGGYNFVATDADVFLSPSRDPLSGMKPLSDKMWDIQFQSDSDWRLGDGVGDPNIGWYWARASAQSIEFLSACYKNWTETKLWDQEVVGNVYRPYYWAAQASSDTDMATRPFIGAQLPYETYLNVMLHGWQDALLSLESFDRLITPAVVVHLTCVETDLKQFVARMFGLWTDLDGYYSSSPGVLQLPPLNGTLVELRRQMQIAKHVARKTKRQIVLPDKVNIVRSRTEENGTRVVEDVALETYKTFHMQTLAGEFVEPRYTLNRERLGLESFTAIEELVGGRSLAEVVAHVDKLPTHAIATLALPALLTVEETAAVDAEEIKMCTAIFTNWMECLRWCGDPKDVESIENW